MTIEARDELVEARVESRIFANVETEFLSIGVRVVRDYYIASLIDSVKCVAHCVECETATIECIECVKQTKIWRGLKPDCEVVVETRRRRPIPIYGAALGTLGFGSTLLDGPKSICDRAICERLDGGKVLENVKAGTVCAAMDTGGG